MNGFDAGSVIARIKADLTEFQAGLKKAQAAASTFSDKVSAGIDNMNQGLKKHEKGIASATVALAAFSAAGIVMLKDWTANASKAEAETAKFRATMATLGDVGINASEALLKASAAATKLGFDDEDAANAMAGFFQRTQDVTKSIELNNLAMDLARAKTIDLSAASVLVGQVMAGNGRVLKQYGIDIKETASPMEALAELQKRVGGQANAFASTFSGRMAVMTQRVSDFKERLGNALLPVLEKFLAIGEKFLAWFESLSPATIEAGVRIFALVTVLATFAAAIGGLLLLIPSIIAGAQAMGAAFALIVSPLGLVIAAVGLFAGIVVKKMLDVQNAWGQATDAIQADVQKQSNTWNAWNNAAAKLAANEQEYASLRAKAQYYILQSTLLTESQIAAIRSGASQDQLNAIQANIDGNNKWAKEAANAAIAYANSHVVNMDKVNAALTVNTGIQRQNTGAIKEGSDAAKKAAEEAAKDQIEQIKNRTTLVKGLIEYKNGVDQVLKDLATEHRDTTDGMRKDIAGLEQKMSDLVATYNKDVGTIKNNLAKNLSDMAGELAKTVLTIKVRLQQEEGQIKSESNRSIAEKFVAQQAEVENLKKKASEATSFSEKQRLEQELAEKQAILETDRQYVVGLETEMEEVKRFNSLTEIQRIAEESAARLAAAQARAASEIAAAQQEYAERAAIAKQEAKDAQTRRTADYMAERAKIQLELGEKRKSLADEIFLYNEKEKAIIDIRNKSVQIYANQIMEMVRFTDRSVNAMIERYEALNKAIQGVGKSKKLTDLTGFSNVDFGNVGRTPTLPDLQNILENIKLPSSVPKLAQGGIIDRPTLAMIGEGGESEAVIPLSKLGDMAGGGWHIHVDGAIIGSVDSAVEVLDMAMRRLRPAFGV